MMKRPAAARKSDDDDDDDDGDDDDDEDEPKPKEPKKALKGSGGKPVAASGSKPPGAKARKLSHLVDEEWDMRNHDKLSLLPEEPTARCAHVIECRAMSVHRWGLF
jgi:hypothetical protein